MSKRLGWSVLVSALLVAGCGSSSSGSKPSSQAAATPAATTAALKGKPISTAHLSAVLPHGYQDETSSAAANTATGNPPDLQLTGPHTANGLKELIRIDVIATNGQAKLEDVEDATISAAKTRGDTIVSGPVSTTAGGEDAYSYEATFKNTANGHTADRESILVRGGTNDYAIIFVAAPKVYAADLKTFTAFLGSISFK